MRIHSRTRRWAVALLITSIGILVGCHPIHMRQSQNFSPLKTQRIAILTDFLSTKSGVVNLERSQKLNMKLVNKISLTLQKKGYIVAEKPVLSVGAHLTSEVAVGLEKKMAAPPLDQPEQFHQRADLREALMGAFREVSGAVQFLKQDKAEPIDRLFPKIGQYAQALGDYVKADELLFVYVQEKKKDSIILVSSVETALLCANLGYIYAKLFRTEFYRPDPRLSAGISAGVGFLLGLTLSENAHPIGCALLVNIKSGQAAWVSSTQWVSGGISGDGVRVLAKNLLKKLPAKTQARR